MFSKLIFTSYRMFRLLGRRYHKWLYHHVDVMQFGGFGVGSIVGRPLMLHAPKRIKIGKNVTIKGGGRFEAVELINGVEYDPEIVIGDGAWIEVGAHISACNRVEIGREVVLASYVYISDHGHGFGKPDTSVMDQPLVSKSAVIIKDQAWIGEKATILSGVTIGKQAVVGANSVVTKDVPDYAVVAGVPARVIRQFEPEHVDDADSKLSTTANRKTN